MASASLAGCNVEDGAVSGGFAVYNIAGLVGRGTLVAILQGQGRTPKLSAQYF
jgi:hypothetical protein